MHVALGGCAGHKAPPAAETSAPAQVSTPVVEATATSLNIRATASSTGAVVGSLKRGERATAPQPAEGGWLYVESDAGPKGYVASQYVRFVEARATAAPAAAAPAAKSAPAPAASAAQKPVATGKFARISEGMTEAQVVEILGPPTSQQNYVTGKAFIPHYHGSDAHRLDYRYKGGGIIVFNRNRYSSVVKVVSIAPDPNEDGYP